MDNRQVPTAEERELCSRLPGGLDGRGVEGRMDTSISVAESLCYSRETITLLANWSYPNAK